MVRTEPKVISWPPSAGATAHLQAYNHAVLADLVEALAIVRLIQGGMGWEIDRKRICGVSFDSKKDISLEWLHQLCQRIAILQRLEQLGRIVARIGPVLNNTQLAGRSEICSSKALMGCMSVQIKITFKSVVLVQETVTGLLQLIGIENRQRKVLCSSIGSITDSVMSCCRCMVPRAKTVSLADVLRGQYGEDAKALAFYSHDKSRWYEHDERYGKYQERAIKRTKFWSKNEIPPEDMLPAGTGAAIIAHRRMLGARQVPM